MNNTFQSKKGILTFVAIIVVVALLVFLLTRLLSPTEPEEPLPSEQAIPEAMTPDNVGDIEEGKTLEEVNPEAITNPVRPPGSSTPEIVSDTRGEIISIGDNFVMVMGSGENFQDQRPRELRVVITAQTITFEQGQQMRYTGQQGLEHLQAGNTILISSSENIRGKTEFTAAYINKI